MYFPYLRGKQFELIALRELTHLMSNYKNKISPVIEPVKNSSTFITTIKELAKYDINFNIIINPKIGDLKNNIDLILKIIKQELLEFNNFQITIIVDNKTNIKNLVTKIIDAKLNYKGISLIHNSIIKNIKEEIKLIDVNIIYNLINLQKTSRRYYRNFEDYTRVELDDFFIAQQKNSDYLEVEDAPFSEEHLYYREEGFVGFSDFLIIGESYSESGFLPYAVAIHISYVDSENKIRVKHFVSDSNEDTSDIAGKFAEALDKLINWANKENINSKAMDEFRNLYESKHFPGLGSIKKLSIMHHIELVLNLI